MFDCFDIQCSENVTLFVNQFRLLKEWNNFYSLFFLKFCKMMFKVKISFSNLVTAIDISDIFISVIFFPSEFTPYVFQIFCVLLESGPPNSPLSQTYVNLFSSFLQPVLWEKTGNIPALVRLIQAYLRRVK